MAYTYVAYNCNSGTEYYGGHGKRLFDCPAYVIDQASTDKTMAVLDAKLKAAFYVHRFVHELAGMSMYSRYYRTQIRIYVIPSEPTASLKWNFKDVLRYPYYCITITGTLSFSWGVKLVNNDTLDNLIQMIRLPTCTAWSQAIDTSLKGIHNMTTRQLSQLVQKLGLVNVDAPMKTRCLRRPIIMRKEFIIDIACAYIMTLQ
jgi:hypothetical protein